MARAGDVVSSKYRLIHPLGMGGMGMVWRAEHIALKQQVALKLLHVREERVGENIKRFQREAQIAASIRHRNIVYISDFGIDGEEPYIVMELLAGVPLSERMVVGEPLSLGVFLHLVDETLQGLAAVHAAGVVHRDMKPENIFLVRESDGTLFPKLLDFGVSRSTIRGQGHTITREGFVMGTPEYISPEQARGRMADTRSDIYSLGVLVYEAIAGRLPFQADNSADLIVAVLKATPLPLSTWRPELGSGLSELIGRAIEREPDKRFQTAEEMRAALRELLAREPELSTRFLPKRFLAPTSTDHEQHATLNAPLSMPVPRDVETALLPRTARWKTRWGLGFAGVAAAVGLSVALGDGHSTARTLAQPERSTIGSSMPASGTRDSAEKSIEPVTVELSGVPVDAEVRVDGAVVQGNTLRFAADSGLHDIVVEAPGKQAWRVQHDAKLGARYTIALPPEKRHKPLRASPPKAGKNALLRRPDF